MIIYSELLQEPPPASQPNSISVAYLTFDERKRGRLRVTTGEGISAGIQIERGQILRDNTWLSNGQGHFLQIHAEKESVTTAYINDSFLFARACYHLGNRHVQLQIGPGLLRYQNDYVLDEMLRGLGVTVTQEMAIFEPENGAYHAPHQHSHREHGHHH